MKSVLISIQPKWCELIASGKKTVEVRKTKPKIQTPFKCYIYCTQGEEFTFCTDDGEQYTHIGNGKVIGEFVCDKIFTIRYRCGSYWCEGLTVLENDRVASASQLSLFDMRNYLCSNDGYGWHITDLVIYDKPKELSEFFKACDKPSGTDCSECIDARAQSCKALTRPTQSWCYVEGE